MHLVRFVMIIVDSLIQLSSYVPWQEGFRGGIRAVGDIRALRAAVGSA